MIEFMDESTGRYVGLRVSGKLTDADYRDVLIPRLEKLIAEHGAIDMLVLVDDDFAGWELHAAWDDMTFGLVHAADFGKIAVVGGPVWIHRALKTFGFLVRGEIRSYPAAKLEAAWEWIAG